MAIEGLAAFNRKMRAVTYAAKASARDAVIQGAYEIADVQERLAPKDDGDLADSIHVTLPCGTTPPYSQPGGSRQAGPEQAIITAGNAKVRYAHLVEFGTAKHVNGGLFEGTQHPGTTAQPFFWPGYRSVRGRVRSRITRSISKAIKQAAGGR